MTEATVVGEFAAGDDVPSWLIDYEPAGPLARPPESFKFTAPVRILEMAGDYWVLPKLDDWAMKHLSGVLSFKGSSELSVFAPAKTVHLWSGLRITLLGQGSDRYQESIGKNHS